MNRSAREDKGVKHFERSNGPDIALHKNYLFMFTKVRHNKLTTRFEKETYEVVDRDGNAVVIQRGVKEYEEHRTYEEAEWLFRDIRSTDDDVHTCGKQRRGARTNRVHSCQCENQ